MSDHTTKTKSMPSSELTCVTLEKIFKPMVPSYETHLHHRNALWIKQSVGIFQGQRESGVHYQLRLTKECHQKHTALSLSFPTFQIHVATRAKNDSLCKWSYLKTVREILKMTFLIAESSSGQKRNEHYPNTEPSGLASNLTPNEGSNRLVTLDWGWDGGKSIELRRVWF